MKNKKIAYQELKPIMDAFAEKGLYLPKYMLNKVYKDAAFNINSIDEYIKYHPKLNNYTDESKVGYSLKFDNWSNEVPRKVIGTSIKNGKKKEFNSIYAASNFLGKLNGVGNICLAAKRGGGIAYGYRWEYLN